MKLQRNKINQTKPATLPPIVHEVLRSPGQPLDPATREFMEPIFGHDFSQVRVHTDGKAAESARKVNALAYTLGQDVVFGEGQYKPESNAGKRLLVHELTHVIQQQGAPLNATTSLTFGCHNDFYEQGANRVVTTLWQQKDNQSTINTSHINLSSNNTPTIQRVCSGRAITRNGIVSSNKTDYENAVISGKYCRDTGFTGLFHSGKTCYREVPTRGSYAECPAGDQVCFDDRTGKCETSHDKISPVESQNADGTCNLHFLCSIGHAGKDVLPWLFSSPGKGALAGTGTGLLLGAGLGAIGGGFGALLGAGIGMAAGAGIGALLGWLRK